MNIISSIFGIPLGFVMWIIYSVIPNYGIALFVFTLLTRLILFPLAINQQKSSARMAAIQPEVAKIQEKYKGDNNRMNEEMNNLYEKEGYNPMSGCLPMLIQFPILFGLIDVVYNPLSHILRFSKGLIAKATQLFGLLGSPVTNPSMLQLDIMTAVKTQPAFFSLLGTSAITQIMNLDYSFLGMDLTLRPTTSMLTGMFKGQFNPVVLIPILSGITSLFMSIYTQKTTAAATGGDDPTAGMMKGMMLTIPLMSLWIAFTVPAGVGLYWVYSNILGTVQSLVMNKFYNPKDINEQIRKEMEEKAEAERQERLETRRQLKAGLLGEEHAEKAMTQKEIDRLRLAKGRERDEERYVESSLEDLEESDLEKLDAARRRDAEKYGDAYIEAVEEDE